MYLLLLSCGGKSQFDQAIVSAKLKVMSAALQNIYGARQVTEPTFRAGDAPTSPWVLSSRPANNTFRRLGSTLAVANFYAMFSVDRADGERYCGSHGVVGPRAHSVHYFTELPLFAGTNEYCGGIPARQIGASSRLDVAKWNDSISRNVYGPSHFSPTSLSFSLTPNIHYGDQIGWVFRRGVNLAGGGICGRGGYRGLHRPLLHR